MTSARSFKRLMAELDSSHTHPLISFKYQDQSPGSLVDASHSSKHCWPTSGQGWRGLGTRGLRRGLCCLAPENWVSPTGRLLSSSTPIP